MSYPLINGASINSSGGSSEAPLVPTRGIPMVLSGTPTLARVLFTPAADALQLGMPRTLLALRPPSLPLAQGGTPIAKFQASLYPVPLPMAIEGQAHLVLTVFAHSADALALGAAKVKSGVDVVLKPWGLNMAVEGWATVTPEQPKPSVTYSVEPSRAMRYGVAAMDQGSIVVKDQGTDALGVGTVRMVRVAKVLPGEAMAMGQPRTVQVLRASSAQALQWGRAGVSTGLHPAGISMAVGGIPALRQAQLVVQVYADDALQLGMPGPLVHSYRARQSFALELGRPSVTRTHQC